MSNQSNERKPLVLVTGATGKTGRPVMEQLRERGYPVRAMVRRRDERSERLAGLGAEVVEGNFFDLASLRSVMAGVKRAYFCYPPEAGLLEATANIAVAAREAGVEALVNMSQLTARDEAGSHLAREHRLSERMLDWANIGAVHVRPTFFAENLYMFAAATIAAEGKIYLPYGDGRHAPVAAEDIARVVAGILDDPAPHAGARYILTGPRNMTMAEMAGIVSEELGKPVEYVNIPIDGWRKALLDRGLPESLASHLGHVARDHQDGVFSVRTDTVERLTGRKPQSLQQFLRANRGLFEGQAAKVA